MVVEPLTDEPDAVFASGRRVFAGSNDAAESGEPEEVLVRAVRPFGNALLVFLDDLSDRTGAEAWRGRYLYLPAEEITPPAEGEVFVHELPGMRVVSSDGREYGLVSGTLQLPQGLALEVESAAGESGILPFVSEMVLDVDRSSRVITVRVPDGLLSD